MNPIDLPVELQIGTLLDLPIDDLVSYSLTSKEAYDICSSHEFLHQYVFRKYNLDLDRIPGPNDWDSFLYLASLLERSTHDYSEDVKFYDPWVSPAPRFEISEDLDDLISEAVDLEYPELIDLMMENVKNNLYGNHDLGAIVELMGAYEKAREIGNNQLLNSLLAYYVDWTDIDYLEDHPEEIKQAVEKLPELAWILLDRKVPMDAETETFVRSILPKTKRYNRVEPLPYLREILHKAETYDSGTAHNMEEARKYKEKIEEIKKLIRPDLTATKS